MVGAIIEEGVAMLDDTEGEEEDTTTEDELEEAAEESDDLPEVSLAPDLVAALADAGIKTKADWDALPLVRVKWPRSCGEPPEGVDVEVVD